MSALRSDFECTTHCLKMQGGSAPRSEDSHTDTPLSFIEQAKLMRNHEECE